MKNCSLCLVSRTVCLDAGPPFAAWLWTLAPNFTFHGEARRASIHFVLFGECYGSVIIPCPIRRFTRTETRKLMCKLFSGPKLTCEYSASSSSLAVLPVPCFEGKRRKFRKVALAPRLSLRYHRVAGKKTAYSNEAVDGGRQRRPSSISLCFVHIYV